MTRITNDLREAGTVLHDEAADRIEALEEGLLIAAMEQEEAAEHHSCEPCADAARATRTLLNTGEKS